MSVKASANRFPIDSLLILEPAASANITATAASANSIALDVLGAYWNTGDVATLLDFAVIVEATTYDHTTGDETYVATVEVATASNFGSPKIVATQAISAVGQYTMSVNRETIVAALGASPTAGFLRVNMTLAGTTPILNYSAYVAPTASV